jgi:hypothetical protein
MSSNEIGFRQIIEKNLTEFGFKSAANFLDKRNRQASGEMVICQLSEDIYHFTTVPGLNCDVELDNAGRAVW